MVNGGTHCLALDFGASSIRLIDVGLKDGRLTCTEISRFAHAPCNAGGHLVWDYDSLYDRILTALQAAAGSGRKYHSIGADSWGVDYVLLDDKGERIGHPVSYRDNRTNGQVERFTNRCIRAGRLFAATGLPPLAFNTLFQLYAQTRDEPQLLRRAERLLLTADYAHYWLCDKAANERTLASTTQMLTLDGRWWDEALVPLALSPQALSPPVPAGTILGRLTPALAARTGLSRLKVIAPCAHDTQSAILAVPAGGDGDWAYLSSGTWSILGVESAVPCCNENAERAGLGNEQGYGGTTCVQSTVTGLWLIQEIERLAGCDARKLSEEAAGSPPFRSLVNPSDPRFFHPENMIAEIKAACRQHGEPVPETTGELARCAYDSLALLYRRRLHLLAEVAGRRFQCLHVVGGGSQAALLNRLTAAAIGIPVLAGPAEATAVGNALAQLIALGKLKDVTEARRLVRISLPPALIEPGPVAGLDEAIARFERITAE